MAALTGVAGFTAPVSEKALSRRRNVGVELIATVALAVSLIVAVTAVSIDMARAQACATRLTGKVARECDGGARTGLGLLRGWPLFTLDVTSIGAA